jgi:folate-binding protein YgfZ
METAIPSPDQYLAIREHCGYFVADDWALVTVRGKDTFAYLQTQTTNDVLPLRPGQGQNSAIVNRTARLIASFSLHRIADDSAFILIEKTQKDLLVQHLQAYVFRDEVTIDADPPENALFTLQGPKCPLALKKIFPGIHSPEKPNDLVQTTFADHPAWIINKTLTGEEGFLIAAAEPAQERLLSALAQACGGPPGLPAIAPETRETLRIEAGLLRYGKDIDDACVLPETGLEHTSVSYNKGCYIGQEVIARIKTYGSPAVAMMGLVAEGDAPLPPGAEILLAGKNIGQTRSATFSPALRRPVALAYIKKEHRIPDQTLDVEIAGGKYRVKTHLLPFYQAGGRTDNARKLVNAALKIYQEEENLDRPITLLREAVELDPKLAQAYEALGVMLSKQDKLDEAIALMKRLAEIDPGEIMAHTNLSIYYMKQGRIEDAENEKAEATALQFEKIIAEKQAQRSHQKSEEKSRLEKLEKISLFEKVLGIDPVDQVANFGLASIYYDLGRHEEALPPAQLLVREYPDYSAAHLLLGKNLEKLGRLQMAAEAYRRGIAAASKKGDLMPLREMQNRLNQILHSAS